MKKKIILDLCGGTGSWAKPYKENGYKVINITLPEWNVLHVTILKNRFEFISADHRKILTVYKKDIHGIIAAPPCTMFSMARTTAKTPRDFDQGMEVVRGCLEIIWSARAYPKSALKFWAIENPTAYLRQFLGKPAMKFHPYEFGDRYKKSTDLWGYFNLPTKKPIVLSQKEIEDSKVNTRPLPKIDGRKLTVADRRAITPQGFSNAFFKANK